MRRIANAVFALLFAAPLLLFSAASAAELVGLLSTAPVTAGGIGGQPAPNAICPEDQVVVGLAVNPVAFGSAVSDWGFFCRELNDRGQLASPSSESNSSYISVVGLPRNRIWCPDGQMAVGIQVVAGKVVSGGGLICAKAPSLDDRAETQVAGQGSRVDLQCPNESVLVGANVRLGEGVERIGGYCSSFRDYRLTYVPNGGSGEVPPPRVIKIGMSITLAKPLGLSRPGYSFDGWSDGEKTFRPFEVFYPKTVNTVLSAVWELLPPDQPKKPELIRDVAQVTVLVEAADTGGLPGYFIVKSGEGLTCTIPAKENSCVIGGLDGGKEYSFTVIAGNESGRSEPSETARTSTVNVPDPPMNIRAEFLREGLRLTWDPPVEDGGSPVRSYLISVSVNGGDIKQCGAISPKTECVISGIQGEDNYIISGISVNDVGESVPAVIAVKPGNPPVEIPNSELAALGKEPYRPADDPDGTLDVLVTGLALLVVAGSASGAAAFTERQDQKEISEVIYGHLIAIDRGSRWGDNSKTWKLPGGRALERTFNTLANSAGRFTSVVGRTLLDGTYFRAMFGSLYLILPATGVLLGYFASRSVDGEVLPPTIGWILSILALATLDAFSGLVSGLLFSAIVLFSSSSYSINSFLLLAGLISIMFAPTLIASSIRPLRRYLQSGNDFVERVGDYAFASLFAGWAAMKMIKGLPAFAEHTLAITEHARTIGVWTFLFVLLRLALEDVTVWAYPRRLVDTTAEEAESWRFYEATTPGVKTLIFTFLAAPFVANNWALAAGSAIFLLAELMPLIEHRLPNLKLVQQFIPKGAVKALVLILSGVLISELTSNKVVDPERRIAVAFVVLALPGLLIKFGAAIADASYDYKSWRRSRSGALVYDFGGVAVFAILAAHAWGINVLSWIGF